MRIIKITNTEYEVGSYLNGEDIPDEFLNAPDENRAIWVSRGVVLGLLSVGFEEDDW